MPVGFYTSIPSIPTDAFVASFSGHLTLSSQQKRGNHCYAFQTDLQLETPGLQYTVLKTRVLVYGALDDLADGTQVFSAGLIVFGHAKRPVALHVNAKDLHVLHDETIAPELLGQLRCTVSGTITAQSKYSNTGRGDDATARLDLSVPGKPASQTNLCWLWLKGNSTKLNDILEDFHLQDLVTCSGVFVGLKKKETPESAIPFFLVDSMWTLSKAVLPMPGRSRASGKLNASASTQSSTGKRNLPSGDGTERSSKKVKVGTSSSEPGPSKTGGSQLLRRSPMPPVRSHHGKTICVEMLEDSATPEDTLAQEDEAEADEFEVENALSDEDN
ncbi:hypothetical protein FRB99_004475 [Tulasnella sp. 403]|nr:hypothetical protein FRB99_004475 [Tulasnella sp. 403]